MGRGEGKDCFTVIVYTVQIAPPVEREVAEAVDWYRSKSPMAADAFRAIVFDAVEMISHSPLSWPKVSDQGVRKVVLPRYPYSKFYSVAGDVVTILAVTHHRRAPRNGTKA
jgi:plasmid stabilization system protein ParE